MSDKLFGENVCSIKIDMDRVYISTLNFEKEIVVKSMSLMSFINTIKNIEKNISTPILPVNCFYYSVKSLNESVFIYSKSSRVDLRYVNGSETITIKDVLFPSFIMQNKFYCGDFNGSYIYALKDIDSIVDISDNTPLYHLKFPNIYASNNICWGRTLENIDVRLKNCGILPDLFKNSQFNNDLFVANESTLPQFNFNGNVDYFNYLSTIDNWHTNLLGQPIRTFGDIKNDN